MTSGSDDARGRRPSSTIGSMIGEGIAGSGGDADEGVVALDLGDADAADPAVGDDGEVGELVDELGVAEHVAAGVVDLGRLAQAVVGGGGAAGEGDAADGDRAHHAGQQPDQHEARASAMRTSERAMATTGPAAEPARSVVGRRFVVGHDSGIVPEIAGSFARRGPPLHRAADGAEAVAHVR